MNPLLPNVFVSVRRVFWLWLMLSALPGFAATQVNIWTNEAGGKWESANWLLGVPPDASQSVQIFNDPSKSVTVDAVTTATAPASLNVDDLLVRSYSDSVNMLLLDHADLATPLTVANGLTIGANGVLANLHSGLIVNAGGLNITDGQLVQDDGFVIATNTSAFITGALVLSNGWLQVSNVYLGGNSPGTWNQYGGDASAYAVQVGDTGNYTATGAGSFNLFGGKLHSATVRVGGQNTYGPFVQQGGTNSTGNLTVAGFYNSPPSAPAHYFLSGGRLTTSNSTIASSLYAVAKFEQTAGSHTVADLLNLAGETAHATTFYIARYNLAGGELTARRLWIDSYACFALTNGTVTVNEALELRGRTRHRETAWLAGGTLACANLTYSGIGVNVTQTGGALVVSNLFSFGGPPDVEPLGPATYNFTGGTLRAWDLEINSAMLIGDSDPSGRIANTGHFQLGGSLTAGNCDEQLGRFILASNATINLAGHAARLAFANSSGESWATGARLFVWNWNGATNGDGAERLQFGNSRDGLRGDQLGQIRFVNP